MAKGAPTRVGTDDDWAEVASVENDPGEDCEETFDPDNLAPPSRFIPEGSIVGKSYLLSGPDGELWMYRCLLQYGDSQGCSNDDALRLFPIPRRDLADPVSTTNFGWVRDLDNLRGRLPLLEGPRDIALTRQDRKRIMSLR